MSPLPFLNPLPLVELARVRAALLLLLIAAACAPSVPASGITGPQQEEGTVMEASPNEPQRIGGGTVTFTQSMQVRFNTGSRTGEVIEARLYDDVGILTFNKGDDVVLRASGPPDSPEWVVIDAVRRPALYWLAGIFAVVVGVIGGWRGLSSIAGIVVSFSILVKFMIPQILGGANPVLISLVGAGGILVVSLYLAHGFSRMTSIALAGTTISLALSALLAVVFVDAARLTGLSEEAFYVHMALEGSRLNLQGLLLGGIMIGILGVLDDVTVSQTSVVFALREANPQLSRWALFTRAMSVGQDHISSLVNTLVLVYAGAALPALLLFTTTNLPFTSILNRELIAVEVVRTLIGSIGLIAAVPITTALAARLAAPSTDPAGS